MFSGYQSSDTKEPGCIFPFIFGNKAHNSCTKDRRSDGKCWCALKVDNNGSWDNTSSNSWKICQKCTEPDSRKDCLQHVELGTESDNIAVIPIPSWQLCSNLCFRDASCQVRLKMFLFARFEYCKTILTSELGLVCQESQMP